VAVAAIACAVPRPAAADLRELALAGWYGKVGLETGVVFARERGTSALLGGVATLVRIDEDLEWYGLQADLLIDGNGEGPAGARWSVGPELGRSIFGFDVGYFGQRLDRGPDAATHHGFQIRVKLTVGVAAVYVRTSYALIGADEAALDVGLQLKAPVWMRRRPPVVTPVAIRGR
jgi:hypothetical protein